MTIVIAVSGPPGSGKSTLCKYLCHQFPTSIYVSMDDFQLMTDWDPSTLVRWIQQGANYNQLPMPGLAACLHNAIEIQNQLSRDSNELHRIVFLESHLGRATDALTRLVKYVVWIDCDLDICLARALLSIIEQQSSPASNERRNRCEVSHYLKHYIALTSGLLRLQQKRIRGDADYVYDGKDVEALVAWIALKAT
jgi:uridine kinase